MTPLKTQAKNDDDSELSQLRLENRELKDRIRQLEQDQELALQLNQMLLEKLHFMSEDILTRPFP